MKQTILVTGGAGFIGSHIVDTLITNKFNVIVLDNLISGKKIFVHKDAIFEKIDITKKQQIAAVFAKYPVTAVLHLAGQPSIINAFTDPIGDVNTNFIGTINMLYSSMEHNVKRFIYASSMTVYGNPQKNPVKETDLCIPINYYGTAKYASERFVHITAERTDLRKKINVTSFRMFNVYGPRQSLTNPYQGVLAIFMGNVLRSEPITIYGDGGQARDFVFVKDVAKVWVDAIENKESFNNVINIGSGKNVSILSLAKKVIKACGKNSETYPIRFKKARPGDQRVVEADISRAKNLLNFTPTHTLQQGLNETLEWARLSATK